MKQTQKIGHQSQNSGIKEVEEKSQVHHMPPAPANTPDSKPAVTNDKGNPVDKQHSDAGKGYNEHKPTDSGASHPAPEPHQQDASTAAFEEMDHHNHKNAKGEPEKHEETDKFQERARQASNVPG